MLTTSSRVARSVAYSTTSDEITRALPGSGNDPVGRLWLYEGGEERVLLAPASLGGEAGESPEAERVRPGGRTAEASAAPCR
ncbi:hypothetical protein [Streptomyces sp. NPDC006307]|uniref:hypothetical protein n=1 Tax=Streptomyces sp. NPDC006307 TaxID=3156748 RepID=UPI00339DF451